MVSELAASQCWSSQPAWAPQIPKGISHTEYILPFALYLAKYLEARNVKVNVLIKWQRDKLLMPLFLFLNYYHILLIGPFDPSIGVRAGAQLQRAVCSNDIVALSSKYCF